MLKKKNRNIVSKIKDFFVEKNIEILLILILFLAILLRKYFFVGIAFAGDDLAYTGFAHSIISGNFHLWGANSIHALRPGLLYPIALSFLLFGINDFSATLFPLILDLVTIILVFFIGKLLFNKKVGIVAAFLFAFFPLHIIYSTVADPDTPLSFFFTASFYIFLRAKIKGKKYRNILFIFSGFILGLGYLVKETNIILFLSFFAILLYEFIYDIIKNQGEFFNIIKNLKKYIFIFLIIFLGFSLIFIPETILHYNHSGDILHRPNVITKELERCCIGAANQDPFYSISWMFPNIPSIENLLNFNYSVSLFGFFYYFVLIALFYMIIKKPKNYYYIIIWFIVTLFYLQFGTMNFKHFMTVVKLDRYFTIVTPVIVVIVSYFFVKLWNSSNKNFFIRVGEKFFVFVSIVFLLITSIHASQIVWEYHNNSMADTRALIKFMEKHPDDTFFIDSGTGHIVFHFQYKGEPYEFINSNMKKNDFRGKYVVLRYNKNLYKEMRPEFLKDDVPENWKLVLNSQNKTGDNNLRYKLYYVPINDTNSD